MIDSPLAVQLMNFQLKVDALDQNSFAQEIDLKHVNNEAEVKSDTLLSRKWNEIEAGKW